jgi:hypothetical protein
MTLSEDDIDRLLVAVETIEESLAILAEQQSIDFGTYRNEPKTQDIFERRFVKATEAALDIAEVIARTIPGVPTRRYGLERRPAILILVDELSAPLTGELGSAALLVGWWSGSRSGSF